MPAFRYGADKVVNVLLKHGADINAMDEDGANALFYAVASKCPSTISLLAPTTNDGLVRVLESLAPWQVEMTESLEEFIKRTLLLDLDQNLEEEVLYNLEDASRHGNTALVKLLLQHIQEHEKKFLDFMEYLGLDSLDFQSLLQVAVESDNVKTCEAILPLIKGKQPSQEVVQIARQRGRRDVMKLIVPEDVYDDVKLEKAKIKMKQDILNHQVGPAEALPMSKEFRYNNEMEKIESLDNLSYPSYPSLLKTLHLPETHTDVECPPMCQQTNKCDVLRQVFHLIKRIVLTMGQINPVFELGAGRHPSIVGSIKEGTRCFFFNELDTHVSLNKCLKDHCGFDMEEQRLVVSKKDTSDMLYIEKYVEGNEFNCSSYFEDFIDTLSKAIEQTKISDGFSIGDKHYPFTMLPLKLDYEPCLRCMDESDNLRPQAKRCRHRRDCSAHHKQNLPECRNDCTGVCDFFSHMKTCKCQEFTSPCVSITKIGAAIHVGFPDGTFVDCDLNVPTIPTSTPYRGQVVEVKKYLKRVRPVGWLEEFSKLEDLGGAGASPHLIGADSWQVKMRRINRDTVLPRQVNWIVQNLH